MKLLQCLEGCFYIWLIVCYLLGIKFLVENRDQWHSLLWIYVLLSEGQMVGIALFLVASKHLSNSYKHFWLGYNAGLSSLFASHLYIPDSDSDVALAWYPSMLSVFQLVMMFGGPIYAMCCL